MKGKIMKISVSKKYLKNIFCVIHYAYVKLLHSIFEYLQCTTKYSVNLFTFIYQFGMKSLTYIMQNIHVFKILNIKKFAYK